MITLMTNGDALCNIIKITPPNWSADLREEESKVTEHIGRYVSEMKFNHGAWNIRQLSPISYH